MQNFEVTVSDPAGIHARPAGVLVKEAQKLASNITLTCRGKMADAKKLIAVMSLCAKCGDTLSVSVEGENEMIDAQKIKNVMEAL